MLARGTSDPMILGLLECLGVVFPLGVVGLPLILGVLEHPGIDLPLGVVGLAMEFVPKVCHKESFYYMIPDPICCAS